MTGRKGTMLRGRYLLFSLVLAGMSGACSQGGGGSDEPPVTPVRPDTIAKIPINISTTWSGTTETVFAQGDAVGLYVVNRRPDGSTATLANTGNQVDNACFTYQGTWRTDASVYWRDDSTHADFYLYYPYRSSMANVRAMAFHVNSDQSDASARRASDLIVGSAMDVSPTRTAVPVTVRHALCRLRIKLVAGVGVTDGDLAADRVQVIVSGLLTQGTLDLFTGEVKAAGEAADMVPGRVADGVYEAVVVPQTVAAGLSVSVNVAGTDYRVQQAATLEGGKQYDLSVTLNKTGEGLSVSITGWDDDGNDYGGTATE